MTIEDDRIRHSLVQRGFRWIVFGDNMNILGLSQEYA